MTRRKTLLLAALASATLAAAAPAMLQAQTARYENRTGSLTRSSYDRMRRFARELDERAREANDHARHDQSDLYRRDTKFLRSVDDFARKAAQFRSRMDANQTRPWNVDEELQRLTKEARDVQQRIRRARFADAHTRQEWDRVVALLGRMVSEYRGDTTVADRDGRRYPDDVYRDRDGSYGRDGSYERDGRYGYPDRDGTASDVRGLARELEERAYRTAELSRNRVPFGYGYGDAVGRFASEARAFRGEVDDNRMTRQQLRTSVERLLQEAERAQSDLSRTGVSREVRAEWDGVVETLQQIRQVAAV